MMDVFAAERRIHEGPLKHCASLADRGEQKQRWFTGRAHKMREQRQTVGVGPLQVIDVHEQWMAFGKVAEQMTQRGEDALATLLGVWAKRGGQRLPGHVVEHRHPSEDWEALEQQRSSTRQERGRFLFRELT